MKKMLGAILLLVIVFAGFAQETVQEKEDNKPAAPAPVPDAVPEPDNRPVVKYFIEAQLLPEARKVMGAELLTWRNTTDTAVDNLRFHLYYNAFRSDKTTFLRESNYYRYTPKKLAAFKYGEIKIKELLKMGGGETMLTQKMSFVSPDDANEDDRTVLNVPLETPVPPGGSITLKIRFELTIPQIFARTGVEGDYYFMAQWFPKLGVLQPGGIWHCHQFHSSSEFYSDYGEYKVIITAPQKFVVAATGNLTHTEKNVDGTTAYTYEEKNIHDFAWTAYPHFERITETIQLKGNDHETVVELLLPPGHEDARFRHLDSLKFALNFFAEHITPYPYKKITLVDPPFNGLMSGGMEYPTLITSVYLALLPDSLKLPEMVTIHEFGHQYWYGIIGTDEFREAWLDEGVNTFFEMEIMDEYFKNSASMLDSSVMKIDDWETVRMRYAALLSVDKVNQPSWEFLNGFQYSSNVYAKAGIFLRSLKNLVGKEKMYNFFKYFVQKYKFKHPTTADFIDTFNSFMNDDFSWAFDQFINGDGKLDHAVHSVESVKISSDPVQYRNEVVFLRKEGYFPVECLIRLENQHEIKFHWKEREKWKRYVFPDESPIVSAEIDPQFKIPLDTHFLNNSIVRKPDKSFIKRLTLRFGFLVQNLMSFLIF